MHKELKDDDTVETIGTEIDSLCSAYEDEYDNVQVYPINDDSVSLLSQDDLSYSDFTYDVDDENNSVCSLLLQVFPIDDDSFSLLSLDDLSYADFSYVVDDEDNSVCSLLTYSTILTEDDEKIDEDELDCAILEKSIDASIKYMIVGASVCIPLLMVLLVAKK